MELITGITFTKDLTETAWKPFLSPDTKTLDFNDTIYVVVERPDGQLFVDVYSRNTDDREGMTNHELVDTTQPEDLLLENADYTDLETFFI